MRAPLTIAAAQPACVPYGVASNVEAHADIVRAAASRVVVFPELSLTGYHLDADVIETDDARLAPLVAECAATSSVALAGAPVASDSGGKHIAVLAIDGGGATVAYRKQWLSAAEAEWFTPGPEPAVLTVDGWRLGLAICKDTGVAQHAADTARLAMDVYVAGVLDSADDPDVQEDRARRVTSDHGVWVVVASFAGSTGGGYEHAAARSRIWSPSGKLVARAGIETDGIARGTLAAA